MTSSFGNSFNKAASIGESLARNSGMRRWIIISKSEPNVRQSR